MTWWLIKLLLWSEKRPRPAGRKDTKLCLKREAESAPRNDKPAHFRNSPDFVAGSHKEIILPQSFGSQWNLQKKHFQTVKMKKRCPLLQTNNKRGDCSVAPQEGILPTAPWRGFGERGVLYLGGWVVTCWDATRCPSCSNLEPSSTPTSYLLFLHVGTKDLGKS